MRFFDLHGQIIPLPPASPAKDKNDIRFVQDFDAGGSVVTVTSDGTVADAEQAEADGSVLMAQNGSLVYYTVAVNDVYAYYRTAQVANDTDFPINVNQFPADLNEMNIVQGFAVNKGADPFPDYDAMAVELKMAWVEAASLPPNCSYIIVNATIPTYTATPAGSANPVKLTETGHRTTKMALISIHVVGSAIGQFGMIWATFEHVCNAPAVGYEYAGNPGPGMATETGPGETGPWLLVLQRLARAAAGSAHGLYCVGQHDDHRSGRDFRDGRAERRHAPISVGKRAPRGRPISIPARA